MHNKPIGGIPTQSASDSTSECLPSIPTLTSLRQGLWPGSHEMKSSLSLSHWVWTLLYDHIGKPTRRARLWKSSAYIVTFKEEPSVLPVECVKATASASKGLEIGVCLHEEVPRWFLLSYMKKKKSWNGKWGQERVPLLRMLGLTRACPALLDVVKLDLLAFSQVHADVC